MHSCTMNMIWFGLVRFGLVRFGLVRFGFGLTVNDLHPPARAYAHAGTHSGAFNPDSISSSAYISVI